MKKRGQLDRNKDNTRKKTKNTDSRPFFLFSLVLVILKTCSPPSPLPCPPIPPLSFIAAHVVRLDFPTERKAVKSERGEREQAFFLKNKRKFEE